MKSKGLSDETIKSPTTSDNSLTRTIKYNNSNNNNDNNNSDKIRVKFAGSCLKHSNKLTYTHRTIGNIYNIYELGTLGSNNSDHTLKNCLFGAITLTKNTDIDKYGYSGYGIGFDRTSNFSFPGGGFSQNVLIFGADMRYCSHIDNKKKNILVLGKGPSEGLEHILTTGKMCSINFTVTKKRFCLSLNYNGVNSYLFVYDIEIYIFRANDSEIVATPLCLGNISKDWPVDNMRKTRINGYVYDLSVDYDAITLIILKIFISI